MADESAKVRKSREDRAAILNQANALVADLIAKGYPALRGFTMVDPQYRPTIHIELAFDFDSGEVRGNSQVAPPQILDTAARKFPVNQE